MEAGRQHMQQEASHEFLWLKRHRLLARAPAGPVVLPPEGHAPVVERDEPLIGDGHAMRIARQIRKDRLRSRERALRINHPFACSQRREPLCEDSGFGKPGVLTKEAQLAPAMCMGELFQEAPPEQPREHTYWQEEAGPAPNSRTAHVPKRHMKTNHFAYSGQLSARRQQAPGEDACACRYKQTLPRSRRLYTRLTWKLQNTYMPTEPSLRPKIARRRSS
ncbi:hypothetical protein F4827_006519 [Paraburkholderia bannensis]|uniref:Uncharacterized protein n=1 Tax=Paraburkholderia bannensis TaxID=765414 RepID=A0A7W9U455_9BURK|nr:hypothetical protein [Paraburkholderia bannensis]